jgi:hypothetical protein
VLPGERLKDRVEKVLPVKREKPKTGTEAASHSRRGQDKAKTGARRAEKVLPAKREKKKTGTDAASHGRGGRAKEKTEARPKESLRDQRLANDPGLTRRREGRG